MVKVSDVFCIILAVVKLLLMRKVRLMLVTSCFDFVPPFPIFHVLAMAMGALKNQLHSFDVLLIM